MKYQKKVASLICTLAYAGLIPLMPGTIGSIIGLIAFFFVTKLIVYFSLEIHNILPIICMILFLFGSYQCRIYLRNKNIDDPKEVIIDEFVGQILTLYLIYEISGKYYSKLDYVIGFVLFRFFDILKPFPVGWFDRNIKGAFGVMIDDVAAALMAAITYYFIYKLAIK